MSEAAPKGPALSATGQMVFQAIQDREDVLKATEEEIQKTAERWASHRLALLFMEIEDGGPDDTIILLVLKGDTPNPLESAKLRALQTVMGSQFRIDYRATPFAFRMMSNAGTPFGKERYATQIEWIYLKKAFENAEAWCEHRAANSTPSS